MSREGTGTTRAARDGWWLRAAELAAWALFAATLFELWVRLADVSKRAKYFEVDFLYLPTLFADLFEWGGHLGGWKLTPAPYLFPDMPLYALARLASGAVEPAQYLAGFAQCALLAWPLRTLLRGLYPRAPGVVLLAPLSLAAVMTAYLAGHFEPWHQLLLSTDHGGAAVNATWCLALMLSQVREPSRSRLGLLTIWALVGAASDGLFAMGWVLPSLVLGAVGAAGRRWRPGAWGAEPFAFLLWPGLAGALGAGVSRVMLPSQVAYMDLRLRTVRTTAERLRDALPSYTALALVFCVTGLVVYGLVRAARRPRSAFGPVEGLAAVALGGILAAWASVVLTGVFTDIGTFRYLVVALVFGVIAAVVVVGWLGASGRAGAVLVPVVLAGVGLSGLQPGSWHDVGVEARLDVEGRDFGHCLEQLAEQEESPTVLSNYSNAKLGALHAGGRIRVLQLNEDATLPYLWITDAQWYCPAKAPGLVVADGLQEAGLMALGPPDAELRCGARRVLVFRGEHRAAMGALLERGPEWCGAANLRSP